MDVPAGGSGLPVRGESPREPRKGNNNPAASKLFRLLLEESQAQTLKNDTGVMQLQASSQYRHTPPPPSKMLSKANALFASR